MPESSLLANAGDDTQAVVTGQAAHVNDAVNAVCAQRLPAVGSVKIPQVGAVRYLSNDRSCERGACRLPWFGASGLLRLWVFLPAPPEEYLELAWGRGLELGSEPCDSGEKREKCLESLALEGESAGQGRGRPGVGLDPWAQERYACTSAVGCPSALSLFHLREKGKGW